ncbi:MAG: AraC family transcriptional regulator [Cyanobacteria bacterium J06642_12]
MRIPLELYRDELVPGVTDGHAATTTYIRSTAEGGDSRATVGELMVGFVLAPVLQHETRLGCDRWWELPLDAGTAWVLPTGLEFQCRWDGPSDFLNVHLPADLVNSVANGRQGDSGGEMAIVPRHGLTDPTLVQLLLNIHSAGTANDDTAAIYRDTLTQALAAHVVRQYGALNFPRDASQADERIVRAIAYIHDYLSQPLDLKTLAGVALMSPYHFAKAFKASTSLPPHQFIIRERIERAKTLLTASRAPISEVAALVGYQTPSRFSQLFKRQVGITPGEFRRQL